MAKGTVVRGTPINSYGPNGGGVSANNGQNPTLAPSAYSGTTTANQYRGDQANKVDPRSGTPYDSKPGNIDNAMALRSSGKYGVSLTNGVVDLNDAAALNGVVFGGVSASRDSIPTPANVMDSPVPMGAQRPDTDSKAKLNALRNGQGKDYASNQVIPDKPNGVLTR